MNMCWNYMMIWHVIRALNCLYADFIERIEQKVNVWDLIVKEFEDRVICGNSEFQQLCNNL